VKVLCILGAKGVPGKWLVLWNGGDGDHCG
jgi:hypothetical protein